MPETISLPPLNIKYKGTFHWDNILIELRKWFKSNYFRFIEAKHKYRPDEKEIELNATIKKTEYARYNITLQIFVLDQKEVEVIKEGEKDLMDEGRLIVTINAEYILDWQKKFTGTFYERLQKFYHQHIIKKRIKQQWESDLENKMKEIQKLIKDTIQSEASYG